MADTASKSQIPNSKSPMEGDVVCPLCFKPAKYPVVLEARTNRYGLTTRAYFGHCRQCNQTVHVEQFLAGDKWHIHRWRSHVQSLPGSDADIYTVWHTVEPLPDPAAPVVTGPGGDYDAHHTLDASVLAGLVFEFGVLAEKLQAFGRKLAAACKRNTSHEEGRS